jgi:hypothetical protein
MDRTREVRTGDEIRACWQAPEAGIEALGGLFEGILPGTHAIVRVAAEPVPAAPGGPGGRSGDRSPDGPTVPVERAPAREGAGGPAEHGRDGLLQPATLAGRLRRALPARGARGPLSVTARGTAGAVAHAGDAAGRRPLVEAPVVPPSGRIGPLGEQLRRAERLRAERLRADPELLEQERLRGRRDGAAG